MPLPLPLLDDADYAALRKALLTRLGPLTPEWTDRNPSDPGIALLELVAFQAEGLLFRFNQIPEATRLAFLRLLDLPLRPATPATGLLRLSPLAPVASLSAPVGARCDAGAVPFTLLRETPVHPGEVAAVARLRTRAPDPETEPELTRWTQAAIDALAAQLSAGGAAPAAAPPPVVLDEDAPGADAPPAAAGSLGTPSYYESRIVDGLAPVDFGQTVDRTLWLAYSLPTTAADKGDLVAASGPPARLVLGFWPAVVETDSVLHDEEARSALTPCPGAEPLPGAPDTRPRRATTWQALEATLDAQDRPRWRTLRVLADTTDGLTRVGYVELELPRDGEAGASRYGVPVPADPDLAGTAELPPPFTVPDGQTLKFWLRAFPADDRLLGPVERVVLNAAPAVQSVPASAEYLGRGDGQPHQRFRLGQRPAIVDAVRHPVRLQVEEAGVFTDWTQVETLATLPGSRSEGRDARVFQVDGEAGEVRFGERGPAYGERVRVLAYSVGGGAAGNVAANAVNKIAVPGLKVENPAPLGGGRDAESVDDGVARIPAELARRDRAVTAEDFRTLAQETPGAGIARAEVLPLFDPRTLNADRAGCVTVIVWPQADPRHPDAPTPTADQRDAVCAYLDPRRLVGTELFVLPPGYRRVAVSLSIAVEPGYGAEATRRVVETILRRYLSPLPPYGPTGRGWPLGRPVRDRELIAAALQVEGVEYVQQLRLGAQPPATPAGAFAEPADGVVSLEMWEVVELADVQVVLVPAEPPAPGAGLTPPVDGPLVPVPVVRDWC